VVKRIPEDIIRKNWSPELVKKNRCQVVAGIPVDKTGWTRTAGSEEELSPHGLEARP